MDVVYFLRSICKKIKSFYILKSAEKQAKVLKKVFEEVSLQIFCMNNKTFIEFVFMMHINWK